MDVEHCVAGQNRQVNFRATSGAVRSIRDCERAAMGLDDLQRQNQADAHAARFGGVERNKKIRWIGEAGPVVFHDENDAVRLQPANHPDSHRRFILMRLPCCIHSIANQVDEGLFQLSCIGINAQIFLDFERDFRPRLQVTDAFKQRSGGR